MRNEKTRFKNFVAKKKKRFNIYTPSELVDLAWCYAKVGARPPKFVDDLTRSVTRRLLEFNMIELGDLFYAFSQLRKKYAFYIFLVFFPSRAQKIKKNYEIKKKKEYDANRWKNTWSDVL